jgi:hypothetical protein
MKMGGSRLLQKTGHFAALLLSPAFCGLEISALEPGAYAPGSTLAPAPQAPNQVFGQSRLKAGEGVAHLISLSCRRGTASPHIRRQNRKADF